MHTYSCIHEGQRVGIRIYQPKSYKLFQVVWIICPLHSPHHPSIFILSNSFQFFTLQSSVWIPVNCTDHMILFWSFESFFHDQSYVIVNKIYGTQIPLLFCSSFLCEDQNRRHDLLSHDSSAMLAAQSTFLPGLTSSGSNRLKPVFLYWLLSQRDRKSLHGKHF